MRARQVEQTTTAVAVMAVAAAVTAVVAVAAVTTVAAVDAVAEWAWTYMLETLMAELRGISEAAAEEK